MWKYIYVYILTLGVLGGVVSITYFVKQDLFPGARACSFGLTSWPVSTEEHPVSILLPSPSAVVTDLHQILCRFWRPKLSFSFLNSRHFIH